MKMKQKIEFNQADIIKMMAEKINFLTTEYQMLHSCFTYDGKGRTITDPVKIAESYQRYLTEIGDIKRMLKMYEMFTEEEKKSVKTSSINA